MQIGALSFQPYIYNTNRLNSASLSKVNGIDDADLTSAKTDYSDLTDMSLNENPLRRGETSNYVDVLAEQMSMSERNEARIMQPSEQEEISLTMGEDAVQEVIQAAENWKEQNQQTFQMQRAIRAYETGMLA